MENGIDLKSKMIFNNKGIIEAHIVGLGIIMQFNPKENIFRKICPISKEVLFECDFIYERGIEGFCESVKVIMANVLKAKIYLN